MTPGGEVQTYLIHESLIASILRHLIFATVPAVFAVAIYFFSRGKTSKVGWLLFGITNLLCLAFNIYVAWTRLLVLQNFGLGTSIYGEAMASQAISQLIWLAVTGVGLFLGVREHRRRQSRAESLPDAFD